jgi:hypothetical protein
MKKWMAAAAAAVLMTTGVLSANADNLVLPEGQTLPLGSEVNVWKGSQSFVGGVVEDFLGKKDLPDVLEKNIRETGVFPESDEASPHELAQLTARVLKNSRLYQLRSDVNDTFYTGLVISLPVSGNDMAQMLKLASAARMPEGYTSSGSLTEEEREAGTDVAGVVFDKAMTEWSQFLTVGEHSSWEDGVSSSGVPYSKAHANLVINQSGLLLPVYVGGFILKGDTGATYNILIADQTSGDYFGEIVDNALQEIK